ncbi:hypothetical protein G7054_g358 [Neopestalotiopsis clavispora]|nr:hypothetical protein G7054_g358 [Neopestalotiopsis clavispora]
MAQRSSARYEEKERRRHFKINFSYPRPIENDYDLEFQNSAVNNANMYKPDGPATRRLGALGRQSQHRGTPETELWDGVWATEADRANMDSPGPRFSSLLSVSKWPTPPSARGLQATPELTQATKSTTIKTADSTDIESRQDPSIQETEDLIAPCLAPTVLQNRKQQPRRKRKSIMDMFPKPPPVQHPEATEQRQKTKSGVLRKKPPQLGPVSGNRLSTSTSNIKDWLHHKHSPLRNISNMLDEPKSAPPHMQHFASIFDSDSDPEHNRNRKSKRQRSNSLHHKRSFKATDVEQMVLSLNAKENDIPQQQHKSWDGPKENPFRRTWSKFKPRIFLSRSERSFG